MRTVYFIKPIGMGGPVKIGCTAYLQGRLSTLNNGSPFELEVIAQMAGDDVLERRFHAEFVSLHTRREWFNPSPKMLEVVAQINAGAFDVESLPAPIALPRNRRVFSDNQKREVGYRSRVRSLQAKTGYKCRDDMDGLSLNWDEDRVARIELFISNPHKYGIPLAAPMARALPEGVAA